MNKSVNIFGLICLISGSAFAETAKVAEQAAINKLSPSVIITHLKVGLMEEYSKTNNSKITQEGDHFNYTPNGECIIDQKKQPCMWWGFSFEYKLFEKNVSLICKTTKITDTDPNNPRSLFTPSTLKYETEIKLTPNNSHMAINMFATEGTGVTTIQTQCSGKDMESMDIAMKINYVATHPNPLLNK